MKIGRLIELQGYVTTDGRQGGQISGVLLARQTRILIRNETSMPGNGVTGIAIELFAYSLDDVDTLDSVDAGVPVACVIPESGILISTRRNKNLRFVKRKNCRNFRGEITQDLIFNITK